MANDKDRVEKINKTLKDKHGLGVPKDKDALSKIRGRTRAAEEGNGKKGKK